MDLGFIDNAITAFKDVTLGIVNLIGKSKLDVTEKERMTKDVQLAGMDFQVKMMELKVALQTKWIELTATAIWRTILIYGVFGLLILSEVNNSIIAPYFPAVKTIAVNAWWWAIAAALVGVDMAEKYRATKKPADKNTSAKTGG